MDNVFSLVVHPRDQSSHHTICSRVIVSDSIDPLVNIGAKACGAHILPKERIGQSAYIEHVYSQSSSGDKPITARSKQFVISFQALDPALSVDIFVGSTVVAVGLVALMSVQKLYESYVAAERRTLEVPTLRDKVATLQAEVCRLEKECESTVILTQERDDTINELKQSVSNLQEQMKNHRPLGAGPSAFQRIPKPSVAQTSQQSTSADVEAQLLQTEKSLREKDGLLMQEMRKGDQLHADMAALEAKLAVLTKENENLKEGNKTSVIQNLEAQNAHLQTQVASLQTRIAQITQECDNIRDQKTELELQAAKLKNVAKPISPQPTTIFQPSPADQERIAHLSEENIKLTTANKSHQTRILNLEHELQEAQSQLTFWKEKAAAAVAAASRTKVDDSSEAATRALQSRLTALNTELHTAQSDLTLAQEKVNLYESQTKEQQRRIEALQQTVVKITAEKDQLALESQTTSTTVPAQLKALQSKLFTIDQENEDLRTKNFNLDIRVAELEKCEHEVRLLTQKLSYVSQENQKLQEQVYETERSQANTIEGNTTAVKSLQQKLSASMKECDDLTYQKIDLDGKLAELERRLKQTTSMCKKLEDENETLNTALQAAETKANSLAEDATRERGTEASRSTEAVRRLEDLLRKSQERAETMELTNTQLTGSVRSLQSRVDQLTQEVEFETMQKVMAIQEKEQLMQQLKGVGLADERALQLQSQVDSMRDVIRNLEDAVKAKEADLENSHDVLKTYMEQNQSLEGKVQELSALSLLHSSGAFENSPSTSQYQVPPGHQQQQQPQQTPSTISRKTATSSNGTPSTTVKRSGIADREMQSMQVKIQDLKDALVMKVQELEEEVKRSDRRKQQIQTLTLKIKDLENRNEELEIALAESHVSVADPQDLVETYTEKIRALSAEFEGKLIRSHSMGSKSNLINDSGSTAGSTASYNVATRSRGGGTASSRDVSPVSIIKPSNSQQRVHKDVTFRNPSPTNRHYNPSTPTRTAGMAPPPPQQRQAPSNGMYTSRSPTRPANTVSPNRRPSPGRVDTTTPRYAPAPVVPSNRFSRSNTGGSSYGQPMSARGVPPSSSNYGSSNTTRQRSRSPREIRLDGR